MQFHPLSSFNSAWNIRFGDNRGSLLSASDIRSINGHIKEEGQISF
jgi:hypothetical protein